MGRGLLEGVYKGFSVSDKRSAIAIALCSAVVVATLPFFNHQLFSTGHDLEFHLARICSIADGLREGQFPVRLYGDFAWGYGYPCGVCYPDPFLYFPALLLLLGVPLTWSYSIFVLAVNAPTALIAYACFKRLFASRTVGLACAVLWVLSIYRLTDVFLRANAGEYLALSFLPVIALGLCSICLGGKRAVKHDWVLLGLGMTGVVLSHVLSIVLVALAGVPLAVVLVVVGCRRRGASSFGKMLLGMLKAFLLCVALSLWFIVPFLDYYLTEGMRVVEKGLAENGIRPAAPEPFQLFLGFWPFAGESHNLGAGVAGEMPQSLGWSLVVVIPAAAAYLSVKALREGAPRFALPVFVAFCVVVLALLWMVTPLFPWHYATRGGFVGPIVEKLSTIQYPWRLLGPASFILVLIVGMVFARKTRFAQALIVVCLAIAFAEAGYASTSLAAGNDFVDRGLQEQIESHQGAFFMAGEYLPDEAFSAGFTEHAKDVSPDPVVPDGVDVEEWSHDVVSEAHIAVTNGTAETQVVKLPLLYYDDWSLSGGAGETTDSSAELLDMNGFVGLQLDAGTSEVFSIRYVVPFVWHIADWVSAAAWVALLAFLVARRSSRTSDSRKEEDGSCL